MQAVLKKVNLAWSPDGTPLAFTAIGKNGHGRTAYYEGTDFYSQDIYVFDKGLKKLHEIPA